MSPLRSSGRRRQRSQGASERRPRRLSGLGDMPQPSAALLRGRHHPQRDVLIGLAQCCGGLPGERALAEPQRVHVRAEGEQAAHDQRGRGPAQRSVAPVARPRRGLQVVDHPLDVAAFEVLPDAQRVRGRAGELVVEQLRRLRVVLHPVPHRADHPAEAEFVTFRSSLLDDLVQLGEDVIEGGLVQLVLAGEVVVDRGGHYLGVGGHVLNAGALEAFPSEHGDGGADDVVAPVGSACRTNRNQPCHGYILSDQRRASTTTVPAVPSTSTSMPSTSRTVASAVSHTAGIPNSRATTAACDNMPPMSVTTAAAWPNSGVYPTSVTWVTKTSPGSRRSAVSGVTTRTRPRAFPPAAATPVRRPPTTRVGTSGSGSHGATNAIGSRIAASRSRSARRRVTAARASAPGANSSS